MPQDRRRHAVDPALVDRARRMGPLPASALGLALALPDPPGLTRWLTLTLDRLWGEAGRPDPFVVVDAGAGDGRRAAGVLAARPGCTTALRWLLVDDGPGAEAAQRRTLSGVGSPPLEDPALVLGPALAGDDPDEPPSPPPGLGPLLASISDLPAGLGTAVVLAVAWMSRLPADRVEWREGRWWEVRLAAGADDVVLEELLVEAGDRAPAGPGGRDGELRSDPSPARRWLASARRVAAAGTVVAVDHFSPTSMPLGDLGAPPRRTEEVPPMLAALWDMGV